MAVVQVIENGGARLEVNVVGDVPKVTIYDAASGTLGNSTIALDAEDLKALIKRCKVVLEQIGG
jgi:hypothetical protein